MKVLTTIFPHLISKRVVGIRSQPQEHFHLGFVLPKNDHIADRDTQLSFPPVQHPTPFFGDNTWIFSG